MRGANLQTVRNMNEGFRRIQQKHDRTAGLIVKGAGLFGVVWLLWALVCLAGAGALVYVAWHFISKFW
jgi:Flp pilus assembly protein TadB